MQVGRSGNMRNWSGQPTKVQSLIRAVGLKSTSTRISDLWRIAGGIAALAILSACDGGFGGQVQRNVTVADDTVTIAGPRGFCVDPRATKDSDGQAFVLLGNCAVLAAGNHPQPDYQALLTAAVRENPGGPISDQFFAVRAYLNTTDGRALLSRSGDPETVRVLDTVARGDVLYIYARDTSDGYAPNMSSEHWRAVFDLQGRIVSVAVLGFESQPISKRDGLIALQDFAGIILNENSDARLTRTGG